MTTEKDKENSIRQLIIKLGLASRISEMVALAKRIPKTGQIDPSDALILQVLCWQMKTKLSEMVTIAERYELDTKQKRDNMDVDIQSECISEKSEAGKQRVSKQDPRWRELQNKRIEAQVLTEYLRMKREDFKEAVYVMRAVLANGLEDKASMPTQEI